MAAEISLSAVQADPLLITARITAPDGVQVLFRPLTAGDAVLLGHYFCSLSQDTIRRYGPHAFDQPTADKLCREINYAEYMRMIAVQGEDACAEVIAYFIFQPTVPQNELERYARVGIAVDPAKGCLIAPSVADAHQSRGLGTPLMSHMFTAARRLGFEKMLLMGGVYLSNERAVHYYRKLGFRETGLIFELTPGNPATLSYDMYIDL
jgi:GNAT superfamily N-acetyltransferase